MAKIIRKATAALQHVESQACTKASINSSDAGFGPPMPAQFWQTELGRTLADFDTPLRAARHLWQVRFPDIRFSSHALYDWLATLGISQSAADLITCDELCVLLRKGKTTAKKRGGGRKKTPKIQARNKKVVADFRNGLDVDAIVEKYGISAVLARKIKSQAEKSKIGNRE